LSHTITYPHIETCTTHSIKETWFPVRQFTKSCTRIDHFLNPNSLVFPSSSPHTNTMASNNIDWSPDYCLACDRQTDGNAYCSESCRLAEYDSASSAASSPTTSQSPSWPTGRQSSNGFFMEPAYNFSNARAYGTTPSYQVPSYYQPSKPRTTSRPVLTPSSSQSSLFSLQSLPASEPTQLSDESKRALRDYASSFDQSRYQRRQSTH